MAANETGTRTGDLAADGSNCTNAEEYKGIFYAQIQTSTSILTRWHSWTSLSKSHEIINCLVKKKANTCWPSDSDHIFVIKVWTNSIRFFISDLGLYAYLLTMWLLSEQWDQNSIQYFFSLFCSLASHRNRDGSEWKDEGVSDLFEIVIVSLHFS